MRVIGSLIGATALAANAQDAQTAHPTRWTLQADPGVCDLERHNAEPLSTLSIRTSPGSDGYRVAIISPALDRQAAPGPASLTFAPSNKIRNGRASILKLPDGRRVIWMEGVTPDVLEDLSGAEAVTMAMKSGGGASVQVAGSAKAVEALRRCNADQLVEWGADAGQFAPGGTMPVAIKARDDWLSKRELLAVMGQSKLPDFDEMFRVAVSPNGMIDGCQSVSGKVERNVEDTVCKAVMGKPLFTAAKDSDDRPVRGVATFRVLLASRPS